MIDPAFERHELVKNLRQVADALEDTISRPKVDPRLISGLALNTQSIAQALAASANRQIWDLLSREFDALDWDRIMRETGDPDAYY